MSSDLHDVILVNCGLSGNYNDLVNFGKTVLVHQSCDSGSVAAFIGMPTKFGAKAGAVGGTLYFTKSIGIWGDSSNVDKAYKTIYGLTAPYLQEIPIEVPELPRITDMTSYLKNSWNSGVLATFKYLLNLPEHASSLAKEGYSMISNQVNTPTEKS